MPHFFRIILIASMVLALIFSSCQAPARADVRHEPPAQSVPAAVQPPIRIALFVDQTGSMQVARVERLSPGCLGPLFERVEATGGEIAVGLIRDRSDAPLVRLFIPPPPEMPAARPLPSNIFAAAAARKQEEAERSRYETLRRAWRADATARINVFATAVAPLFTHPADAPRTDVRSAIVRASVFLAEPNAFPRPPKNIVVFVSDGLDTVNHDEPPRLGVPADVLIVNGVGTLGYLAPLHPIRFEALDAALRFVVNTNAEKTQGDRNVRR